MQKLVWSWKNYCFPVLLRHAHHYQGRLGLLLNMLFQTALDQAHLSFWALIWMGERDFQYCFSQLFKSQNLSSELSSTPLLKFNLLPFVICSFSRDLCNVEIWKCLSSKYIFQSAQDSCQVFLDLYFLSHCTAPIFPLFILSSPALLEFGATSSLSYKKNPPFLWTIHLSCPSK